MDKRGQFADFTENFNDLTETLVDEDDSIRDLLDDGPDATKVVREVVEENSDDLVSIFNSLAEVTATFDRRWKSLEVLTILFMAQVDGGFAAVIPSTDPKRAGLLDGRIPVVFSDACQASTRRRCAVSYGGADAEGYRAIRPPDDLTNAEVKHYDCLNDDKVPFNPRKTEYNFDRARRGTSNGRGFLEVASAGDGLELKADPRTSTKSIRLLIASALLACSSVGEAWRCRTCSARATSLPPTVKRSSPGPRISRSLTTPISSDQKADYQRRVKPLMTPSTTRTS